MDEYDFIETLNDLDAGVFSAKLTRAVKDVAIGAVEYGKTGKVVIDLTMKRIGESHQVNLEHKLKYDKPTLRGKSIEEDATSTPMHVGRGGKITLMPDTQESLNFNKDHNNG